MQTFCRRIERRVGKKVQCQDGRGVTTVPDGTESAYIELEIDVDWLLTYLGEKAMRNRSGRAVHFSGRIIARAKDRRRAVVAQGKPDLQAASDHNKRVGQRMLAALNAGLKDL